jgi:hypothetical protein
VLEHIEVRSIDNEEAKENGTLTAPQPCAPQVWQHSVPLYETCSMLRP